MRNHQYFCSIDRTDKIERAGSTRLLITSTYDIEFCVIDILEGFSPAKVYSDRQSRKTWERHLHVEYKIKIAYCTDFVILVEGPSRTDSQNIAMARLSARNKQNIVSMTDLSE